jgi:hypothetical protein
LKTEAKSEAEEMNRHAERLADEATARVQAARAKPAAVAPVVDAAPAVHPLVTVTFITDGLHRLSHGDPAVWAARAAMLDGEQPALWVRRFGPVRFATLAAHPEINLYQHERINDAMMAIEAGDVGAASKLLGDVERELGLLPADLLTIGRAERALGLIVTRRSAKEAPAKGKRGRKASGLRDLSPEAARYAVTKASVQAVRAAEELYKRALKMPGVTSGTPSLGRMLKGDLEVASVLVADPAGVSLQPVLRSSDHVERLRRMGVPADLLFVAKAFMADIEGSTIGKLTASYGEGLGGAASAEPERLMVAMDRLVKAQKILNRHERFAAWGALVFGLTLHDIGWSLYGQRFGSRAEPLINAAALHLEGALERMEPWYLAGGRPPMRSVDKLSDSNHT